LAYVQSRTIAKEIADAVLQRGQPFESKQGALDLRDAYFGTTIEPQQLLGWPIVLKDGAVAGAVVAIRRSLRPFSLYEKDVVAAVCDRIALGSSARWRPK
jgi:hypothetical protein